MTMEQDTYSKSKKRSNRRQSNLQHKEVRTPKYRQRVVDNKRSEILEECFVREQFQELENNNDESI